MYIIRHYGNNAMHVVIAFKGEPVLGSPSR